MKRNTHIIVFCILYTNLFGQLDTAWVRRYNGPANGSDYAYAIAVDNLKNVYVTGASQGSGAGYINDFAAVKYDSLGTEQWAARYNGSSTHNWPDEARAIAVDANGVYVTGYISHYILEDSCDYCTIKYDKQTGDTIWSRKYNGPANKCDKAYAIGLDSSGNVYVTGESKNSGDDFDFLTVKYNPTGVEQWTARYNNPSGNGWDMAYALANDNSGNVFVTGQSYDLTTYYDCVTIKYNSSGIQQWVQRYSYENNTSDEGNAITVDNQGNVYVTGQSISTTTSWDYATIKYNATGTQQWVARYNGMSNYDDYPNGIGLDNSGNIYVTGKSGIGSFFYRFATVKYTANGIQEWANTFIGPANLTAWANDVVIDPQNNIFVTGFDYASDTTAEYVTIKYLPNGTEQSITRYSADVNHGDDWATAICVDQNNCVYVTGYSESIDGNFDYLTIKYVRTQGIEEVRGKTQGVRGLEVYPNPTKNYFTIRLPQMLNQVQHDKMMIKMFDVSGKLIKELKSPGTKELRVSLKGINSGIYFIRVSDEIAKEKLVISK